MSDPAPATPTPEATDPVVDHAGEFIPPSAPTAPVPVEAVTPAPQSAPTPSVPSEAPVPTEPAPATAVPGPAPLPGVWQPLSDDEARPGHFALVVDGEHKGRYGTIVGTYTERPDVVTFRTRDDRDEFLVVNYDDLRPDTAGKR